MTEENKEKEEVTEENNNQQDNLQSSDINTSTGDSVNSDYSDEQAKLNLTQLEQRITSLEQRINVQHVEQPQSQPNDDKEDDVNNQNSDDTNESSSPEKPNDEGGSLADIEKILNL